MIAIGQQINGFTIVSIAAQYRAGQADGAVILGQRSSDGCLIVATLEQSDVESRQPATFWREAQYWSITQVENATGVLEPASVAAVVAFLDTSRLTALLDLRDLTLLSSPPDEPATRD